MSYNKTIWRSKDIITREKMQKIEDQLEVLSEQETSGTSDYLELENKPQINGVTLTGNKTLTDLGAAATSDVAAKYTKPGTGIPASDLSNAVQASLNKADTALQGENLASTVNNYIETNFSNPSSPPLDRTLSSSASAAPADMVGDLKSAINALGDPPNVAETDAENVDLDITDDDGYVLMRLADGHIQTQNFNSHDFEDAEEKIRDAVLDKKTNADSDLDITDIYGYSVARFKDGHIDTKYFNSRAITPIVISVKADGTGDFASLRAAVDNITDANSDNKPYEIDIYPGTYNILADYTNEEIEANEFFGLFITDGISVKGIGNRDEIILHGELSPSDFDANKRNDIATLNFQGTASLENVTVTARNIRYCVHDDFPTNKKYSLRHVKNCKFRGYALTSGGEVKTWGEGSRAGKTTIIEDCDFGTCFLWHSDNTASTTRAQKLIVKNSTAFFALIANRNHQVFNNVHLYNNNFAHIRIQFADVSTTGYHMSVDGNGHDAMTYAPVDWNYTNGDIVKFITDGTQQFSVGDLVIPFAHMDWGSGSLAPCTDVHEAYGVVVGLDSEWIYVQARGYIHAERVGLNNTSVGDKITVDTNGALEVNGSGETFGVITCVTSEFGSYFRRIA